MADKKKIRFVIIPTNKGFELWDNFLVKREGINPLESEAQDRIGVLVQHYPDHYWEKPNKTTYLK